MKPGTLLAHRKFRQTIVLIIDKDSCYWTDTTYGARLPWTIARYDEDTVLNNFEILG